MEPATQTRDPWHALSVADVADRIDTDLKSGLSTTDAERRLLEVGRNELEQDAGAGRIALFLSQFRDVMIWILLVAAAISGFLLGEIVDPLVIVAIVILNAVLGYFQEARAEDALARLKELSAPEAVAVRDGEETTVPATHLVPGDLVVLEAGDRVPADARLVEAVHLEVDEASLTGESLPVLKSTSPTDEQAALGDRTCMVMSGTTVTAGRGQAVITATGGATEMGRIAELLGAEEPPTPLQVELNRVGRRLAALAVLTAGIVFLVGALRGNPAERMFLIAVALAVAAIPEGLPAVVTITLSRGVQRMAAEDAIVRRLPAVEALGSATVICTDKTGTLTRNEMRVQEIVVADMRVAPHQADVSDARIRLYSEIAACANDARVDAAGVYLGDPTEVALLRSVEEIGPRPEDLRAALPRIDELAFDSRRKRMSTLHYAEDDGDDPEAADWRLYMKGAPEAVIDRSTHLEGPDGPTPMNDARIREALDTAEQLAVRGLRTLAFAYRWTGSQPDELGDEEHDLVLVAVVGMSDEARTEAAPAVAEAKTAGIRTVMVTGDHAVTAETVARELGICTTSEEVMDGATLSGIDTDQLSEIVDRYAVYARVDPVDKVKIVHAWQRRGEIVAMTGDGVNDAPALVAADIGVAMGSGTDVAKDASAMVLADDNYATIVSAVAEGRTIFANLKKVVHFLLSANISEVLVMLLGFVLFGALGEPLLAVQLLWINLVTDGLPAIALGMDPALPWTMVRPPDRQRDILSVQRQLRLLVLGSALGVLALAALVISHFGRGLEWEAVQTTTFSALVVLQLVYAFVVRSPRTSVWRDGFFGNRLLGWGVTTSFALHLLVVYTPLGNTLFGTVPIDGWAWLIIAGLAVAMLLVVDPLQTRLETSLDRRIAARESAQDESTTTPKAA